MEYLNCKTTARKKTQNFLFWKQLTSGRTVFIIQYKFWASNWYDYNTREYLLQNGILHFCV